MKSFVPWTLFIVLCLGVGFLHGILPQGLDRAIFVEEKNINIVTFEKIFFPEQIIQKIGKKFNTKINVHISKDWKRISAECITDKTADLLIIPSHWAKTLNKQNVLDRINDKKYNFNLGISPDFIQDKFHAGEHFIPIFWLKTTFVFPTALDSNKSSSQSREEKFYVYNDEDHILEVLDLWEKIEQNSQIFNKLESLDLDNPKFLKMTDGLALMGLENSNIKLPEDKMRRALFIWGAVIPRNSKNKEISRAILFEFLRPEHQEEIIKTTPLATTRVDLQSDMPQFKKSVAIRDLKLSNTSIYHFKDPEAKTKIKQKIQTDF